jgi:Transposase IS116/IS110/IS902 family
MLRDEWVELVKRIKEIDRLLVAQAKDDPLDAIYRSVPGVGPLISRILSAELGDMSQFPNEPALFSFTGLTPSEYSSGGHICRVHPNYVNEPHSLNRLSVKRWLSPPLSFPLFCPFVPLSLCLFERKSFGRERTKILSSPLVGRDIGEYTDSLAGGFGDSRVHLAHVFLTNVEKDNRSLVSLKHEVLLEGSALF